MFSLLSLCICLLWVPHVNGIIKYLYFCVWLTLSTRFSAFTRVMVCVRISFPLKAECMYRMYAPHFVYPCIHQRVCELLPPSATVNNPVVNMSVQVSGSLLSVFGYVPKSGSGGSYKNSVSVFSLFISRRARCHFGQRKATHETTWVGP